MNLQKKKGCALRSLFRMFWAFLCTITLKEVEEAQDEKTLHRFIAGCMFIGWLRAPAATGYQHCAPKFGPNYAQRDYSIRNHNDDAGDAGTPFRPSGATGGGGAPH